VLVGTLSAAELEGCQAALAALAALHDLADPSRDTERQGPSWWRLDAWPARWRLPLAVPPPCPIPPLRRRRV
jgi:hypothetical protein